MEFAKKLLKYCQGELSKEDEEEVRRVVERNPELKALVEELRDKERIGETVRLLEKFDAERALRKVFLRCPKAAVTIWPSVSTSTGASSSLGCGRMRTIDDVTFGAGTKAPGGTSKSFCIE